MRIITLIENLSYKKDLIAEHGLSYLIESENKKILFDTGQTGNFIANARNLNIDIQDIDVVVISHGHYDHTGGLYAFLQINKKAKVYLKKEVFVPKYNGSGNFNGIAYIPSILDSRIEYIEKVVELDEGVFIMPDIPMKNSLDLHFRNFKLFTSNGFVNDDFRDELFICIRKNDKISIITSCSHRGITNIMDAAHQHFNLPFNTILGGFHMRTCLPEQMEIICRYFGQYAVESIGVCHCTGVEKYAELTFHFKKKVFYNDTGNVVEII